MKTYPAVLGEVETLQRVLAGASLARYGDGEFKLCRGGAIKSQPFAPTLSRRLQEILLDSGDCLVGIPNIHSETPKSEFWTKYLRESRWLVSRPYVSAFVTRPDSAPWINTPSYWDQLVSLWRGRDVTLVRGSGKSLTAEDIAGAARTVTEIVAPRQGAWGDYEKLLKRIGTPERVLICLGPTATVMAVDLCAKGVHAIDLGHVGMFLRKYRRGDPMWVTDVDRAS